MKHVLLGMLLVASTMAVAPTPEAHAVSDGGGSWPVYYQANWYGGMCHINVTVPGVGTSVQSEPSIGSVYDCYLLAWYQNYWTEI